LGAPILLPPGNYWLAVQNIHATNTFALAGTNVGGNFTVTVAKAKATGSTNGATLDIIAATWNASNVTPAAMLRGRAAGDTVAW
jgi:hypothetical protein